MEWTPEGAAEQISKYDVLDFYATNGIPVQIFQNNKSVFGLGFVKELDNQTVVFHVVDDMKTQTTSISPEYRLDQIEIHPVINNREKAIILESSKGDADRDKPPFPVRFRIKESGEIGGQGYYARHIYDPSCNKGSFQLQYGIDELGSIIDFNDIEIGKTDLEWMLQMQKQLAAKSPSGVSIQLFENAKIKDLEGLEDINEFKSEVYHIIGADHIGEGMAQYNIPPEELAQIGAEKLVQEGCILFVELDNKKQWRIAVSPTWLRARYLTSFILPGKFNMTQVNGFTHLDEFAAVRDIADEFMPIPDFEQDFSDRPAIKELIGSSTEDTALPSTKVKTKQHHILKEVPNKVPRLDPELLPSILEFDFYHNEILQKLGITEIFSFIQEMVESFSKSAWDLYRFFQGNENIDRTKLSELYGTIKAFAENDPRIAQELPMLERQEIDAEDIFYFAIDGHAPLTGHVMRHPDKRNNNMLLLSDDGDTADTIILNGDVAVEMFASATYNHMIPIKLTENTGTFITHKMMVNAMREVLEQLNAEVADQLDKEYSGFGGKVEYDEERSVFVVTGVDENLAEQIEENYGDFMDIVIDQ